MQARRGEEMRIGIQRINLVQFGEDKFGVRFGWLFHTYQDFCNKRYKWTLLSDYFCDCVTTEEIATKNLNS